MLLASFSLPPDALALEQTLHDVPAITVEAERVAAHSTEWVMPSLWVTNAETDTVTAAFSDDPTVESIVEVTEFSDEIFCHIEWSEAVERRINTFVDKEGSILSAVASDGDWQLRVRFTSQAQLDEFREHFEDQEYTFQLVELTDPDTPHRHYDALTDTQQEALLLALELGYYQVPREITIGELAEELDVSHQAVSELLRRGTGNLIQTLLTTGRGESL